MYSNSVGAILVPILQQLDKQMENIMEWRIVKYYIHQGNSIIRLAVELLDSKCHSISDFFWAKMPPILGMVSPREILHFFPNLK